MDYAQGFHPDTCWISLEFHLNSTPTELHPSSKPVDLTEEWIQAAASGTQSKRLANGNFHSQGKQNGSSAIGLLLSITDEATKTLYAH